MPHCRSAVPAILAVGALITPAAAHADTTLTFKELDKGSNFDLIDNAPKAKNPRNPSLSMGDQLVFTNPIADASGAHIGKLQATCSITKPSKTFDNAAGVCFGIFTLKGGTLIGAAYQPRFAGTTINGAIVGGTGQYADARGTFVSKEQKNHDEADTITLVG